MRSRHRKRIGPEAEVHVGAEQDAKAEVGSDGQACAPPPRKGLDRDFVADFREIDNAEFDAWCEGYLAYNEAEGVSLTLVGEGAAVWNKTTEQLDAYLLAAEYDGAGRQRAVGVTALHLAPGERAVTPVPRGNTRLFLCTAEWIPLTAPLDA